MTRQISSKKSSRAFWSSICGASNPSVGRTIKYYDVATWIRIELRDAKKRRKRQLLRSAALAIIKQENDDDHVEEKEEEGDGNERKTDNEETTITTMTEEDIILNSNYWQNYEYFREFRKKHPLVNIVTTKRNEKRWSNAINDAILFRNIDSLEHAEDFDAITSVKTRKIANRSRSQVEQIQRVLRDRVILMVKAFVFQMDRYRDVHPDFFDYLVSTNVTTATCGRGIRTHQRVLTHLINYSPSVTLAQFYFFVLRNEFTLSEVCELFLRSCQFDDLFVRRTRYIINRYQQLGDSRGVAILDRLCVTDMFLYPLLAKRKVVIFDGKKNDEASTAATTDTPPTTDKDRSTTMAKNEEVTTIVSSLVDGVSSSAHDMYESLYTRPCVIDILSEYYSQEQQRLTGACRNENSHEFVLTTLTKYTKLYDMVNLLYWRYNGATFVDSSSDTIVPERCKNQFAQYLFSSITLMARQMYQSSLSSATTTSFREENDTTAAVLPTTKRKKGSCGGGNGGGGGITIERSARKTFDLLISGMIDSYRSVFSENKNESCGLAASGGGGRDGAAFVSSETIERFVRYIDKTSSNRVMLNLYLNRFEFSTPAVSRMLTINYDDSNPPNRYRFNETLDENVHNFVQSALERVSSYVNMTCSRDVINHYLYSTVVPKRIKLRNGEEKRREDGSSNLNDESSVTTTPQPFSSVNVSSQKRSSSQILFDEVTNDVVNLPPPTHSLRNERVTINKPPPATNFDISGKHTRDYDKRFVCQVTDLTNTLAKSLSPYDARRVLESHIEAKRLVLVFVNFANVFGSRWLTQINAVDRLSRVLIDCVGNRNNSNENSDSFAQNHSDSKECCPGRLLFAPLACRVQKKRRDTCNDDNGSGGGGGRDDIPRRILNDTYVESASFLARYGRDFANAEVENKNFEDTRGGCNNNHDGGGESKRRKMEDNNNSNNNNSNKFGCETNRLLSDLRKYQRNITFTFPPGMHEKTMTTTTTVNDENNSSHRNSSISSINNGGGNGNFITSVRFVRDEKNSLSTNNITSDDAMREFLTSWALDEFAKQHSEEPCVLEDLSAEQTVTLATLYLFLLSRERIRHSFFTDSKCFGRRKISHHVDDVSTQILKSVKNAIVRKRRSNSSDENFRAKLLSEEKCPLHDSSISCGGNNIEYNLFGRLSRNFDDCSRAIAHVYPELYIHSYDTNCLAEGLAIFVNGKIRSLEKRLSHETAYAISIAIISLFIFSRNNVDILIFYLQYITAIRFPGQFLKTVLFLQGTSDSGKSEFVSEVLRLLYSSSLTGTISNATLRNGVRDEINTDLMSMMNSHVCQIDEPDRVNSELFKLLNSRGKMKGRMFHEQQPQHLINLAKIIITSNDHISMRGDDGVTTRLKFCVRMMHRFKQLHNNSYDTRIDFDETFATPSISYQFATRCFAQGVSFAFFRLGLFLAVEHYGITMCEYDESFYAPSDVLSKRMAVCDNDSQDTRKHELDRFRLVSLCGVMVDALRSVRDIADCMEKNPSSTSSQATFATDNGDNSVSFVGENVANDEEEEEEEDDDDDYFNRDIAFSTYASAQLLNPIQIDNLPIEIKRDSANLHTLIDPYKLLKRTYDIEHDISISMTEAAMTNFLRAFIGESGCNVAAGSIREVVGKIKERLRTDYPNAYRTSDNIFNIVFKNHQQKQ